MGRVIGLHDIGSRVVLLGIRGMLVALVDGGEGGVGGDWVPSHAIILARSVHVPFEISRGGSKVGVGEDVGVLS